MRLRLFHRLCFLMGLLCLFVIPGCVGSHVKVRKVESPTEKELRSTWRNFHTFCLEDGYGISTLGSAILFQVKLIFDSCRCFLVGLRGQPIEIIASGFF